MRQANCEEGGELCKGRLALRREAKCEEGGEL